MSGNRAKKSAKGSRYYDDLNSESSGDELSMSPEPPLALRASPRPTSRRIERDEYPKLHRPESSDPMSSAGAGSERPQSTRMPVRIVHDPRLTTYSAPAVMPEFDLPDIPEVDDGRSVAGSVASMLNYSADTVKYATPGMCSGKHRAALLDFLVKYKAGETKYSDHVAIRFKVREILIKVICSKYFTNRDISIIARHLVETMMPRPGFATLFHKKSSMQEAIEMTMTSRSDALLSSTTITPTSSDTRSSRSPVRGRMHELSRALKLPEYKPARDSNKPFFLSNYREFFKHLGKSALSDQRLTKLVEVIFQVEVGIYGVPINDLVESEAAKITKRTEKANHLTVYHLDDDGLPETESVENPSDIRFAIYGDNGVITSDNAKARVLEKVKTDAQFEHAGQAVTPEQEQEAYWRMGEEFYHPIEKVRHAGIFSLMIPKVRAEYIRNGGAYADKRLKAGCIASEMIMQTLYVHFKSINALRDYDPADRGFSRSETPLTDDGSRSVVSMAPASTVGPSRQSLQTRILELIDEKRDLSADIEALRRENARLTEEEIAPLKRVAEVTFAIMYHRSKHIYTVWSEKLYGEYVTDRRLPSIIENKTYAFAESQGRTACYDLFTTLRLYLAALSKHIEVAYYKESNKYELLIVNQLFQSVKHGTHGVDAAIKKSIAANSIASTGLDIMNGEGRDLLLSTILQEAHGIARNPINAVMRAFIKAIKHLDPRSAHALSRARSFDSAVKSFLEVILLPLTEDIYYGDAIRSSTVKRNDSKIRISYRFAVYALIASFGSALDAIEEYGMIKKSHPGFHTRFDEHLNFIDDIASLLAILNNAMSILFRVVADYTINILGEEIKLKSGLGSGSQGKFASVVKASVTQSLISNGTSEVNLSVKMVELIKQYWDLYSELGAASLTKSGGFHVPGSVQPDKYGMFGVFEHGAKLMCASYRSLSSLYRGFDWFSNPQQAVAKFRIAIAERGCSSPEDFYLSRFDPLRDTPSMEEARKIAAANIRSGRSTSTNRTSTTFRGSKSSGSTRSSGSRASAGAGASARTHSKSRKSAGVLLPEVEAIFDGI